MGVCSVMITSVFAFGMIEWPNYPKDGSLLGNLYYITSASVLYALSVLVFIAANSFWWKVGSALSMAIFSVNLYVEVYLDPTKWSSWDATLLIVVSLNTLIMTFIIEKLKSWRKPKS